MDDEQEETWTPEAFVGILQRQIRELEAERIKLHALNRTADDHDDMQDVVAKLQSFRQILAGLESELKGESTDEGKSP